MANTSKQSISQQGRKIHADYKTVWTEECRSWYKSGSADGKVAALWPGSTLHYLEALSEPRWEDWTWERGSSNRFEYLGNGLSSTEARPGGDASYYIRNADDSRIDAVMKPSAHTDGKALLSVS